MAQSSWDTAPPGASLRNDSYAVGFLFTVTENVTVSRLGRQYQSGDSLDHTVRLWDDSDRSTPLAVAVVLEASLSDGDGIKWVDITPVNLTPGGIYAIAIDDGSDEWPGLWIVSAYLDPVFSSVIAASGYSGYYPAYPSSFGAAYATPSMWWEPTTTPPIRRRLIVAQ
jgi:hypothetical protein